MFSPKKILVPTDFSKYSDKALQQAADIAKEHNSTIYLFHVIGIIQQCAVDYCLDNQIIEELEKKSIDSSKEMMKEQINKIAEAKSLKIITDVKKGTPYEEILKEQAEKKIDLIVTASHGKTGLMHYLMGSVAEKVVKGAKCTVMLVKA
ncbi:MAG: universal stress protein [Proteobacteria bacterium]|nr:universal stress protein [Pseudomonadota bacterium]